MRAEVEATASLARLPAQPAGAAARHHTAVTAHRRRGSHRRRRGGALQPREARLGLPGARHRVRLQDGGGDDPRRGRA